MCFLPHRESDAKKSQAKGKKITYAPPHERMNYDSWQMKFMGIFCCSCCSASPFRLFANKQLRYLCLFGRGARIAKAAYIPFIKLTLIKRILAEMLLLRLLLSLSLSRLSHRDFLKNIQRAQNFKLLECGRKSPISLFSVSCEVGKKRHFMRSFEIIMPLVWCMFMYVEWILSWAFFLQHIHSLGNVWVCTCTWQKKIKTKHKSVDEVFHWNHRKKCVQISVIHAPNEGAFIHLWNAKVTYFEYLLTIHAPAKIWLQNGYGNDAAILPCSLTGSCKRILCCFAYTFPHSTAAENHSYFTRMKSVRHLHTQNKIIHLECVLHTCMCESARVQNEKMLLILIHIHKINVTKHQNKACTIHKMERNYWHLYSSWRM